MSLIRFSYPLQESSPGSLLHSLGEGLGEGVFAPPVDVKEDAEAYTVLLDVPGVSQDNIHVELQDNILAIRGTKEQKSEVEGRYRRVERRYGTFSRTLHLPRNVDEAGVTANLEDGVLEIRLPKREDARPRQINVGATHENDEGRTEE